MKQYGEIWKQGNTELQLTRDWGIPPIDALGTVWALRVKELVAERQMKKPHRTEKSKAELLTRHKSMSQKVCWPSWDGEIESFLPLRLLLRNGWCLNLYRAAKSHSLSLLHELLNSNKSRKLTFLKMSLLPILR